MWLFRIRENPENPRVITPEDFDKLIRSILSLPKMLSKRKIILKDRGSCEALGGNQRLAALKAIAGMDPPKLAELINSLPISEDRKDHSLSIFLEIKSSKRIPDDWIDYADDWTEEERSEFLIKDNNSYGEWDLDALELQFDEDILIEWNTAIPAAEMELPKAREIRPEKDPEDEDRELPKGRIILEYTAEDYQKVWKRIGMIGGSPEKIFWDLLELE